MKKIWLFLLLACFIVGCNNNKHKEELFDDEEEEEQQDVKEPKKSVAKETTWDFHLIGKWHYVEAAGDGEASKYPEGIEVFHANGDYECYTQDAKGQKVLINGTWKLDDKKAFVVWVAQESVANAKGTVSDKKKKIKYVINALAPEAYLTYQVNKVYRAAQWVGQ